MRALQHMKKSQYVLETNSVKVSVNVLFLEDDSLPHQNHYIWAYQIQLENHGREKVQLLRRYWKIVDGLGRIQEVEGEGVVGEQPTLDPGDAYDYTSGIPLTTPSGIMGGYYEMKNEKGEIFQVAIPSFSLDSPYEQNSIN
jgi:ApaG protein